ncbi:MAG: MATE family efflux transporter [Butyrivibrio sp.]|nr:MATE family efflux transporter [Butyrivibrio sp.]
MARDISAVMRSNNEIDFKQKVSLVWLLSVPTMLAQISLIAMQYIDAAMVGSLGANASASIGLMSSTTWLFGGVCSAASYGFSVQIAHAVGAGDRNTSKRVFRQGFISVLVFALVMMLIGIGISGYLPIWLRADESIRSSATAYFRIYAMFVPVRQILLYCGASLQASGNTKVPGILDILMCALDVIFNAFFIFGAGTVVIAGVALPGLGLGVKGAALGTGASEIVTAVFMIYFACIKQEHISVKKDGLYRYSEDTAGKALKISLPMAMEQIALCGAQIITTGIVAPLGTVAVAAHSFAITVEGLCYEPGYGLQAAATTLVGQALGAGKKDLVKSFGWITTFFGIIIMTVTGFLMYFICPYIFGFLTPDMAVRELGISVLRIELLAEPLFAASIVATGALRGVGDTFIPSIMNLVSMWGVRIVLSLILTPMFGLAGVWIAMCVELIFRGIIFLIRLKIRLGK